MAPGIIAPTGGVSLTTDMPTFTWTTCDGAAHYWLWVDDATTGTTQVVNQQTLLTTSCTLSAIQALTPGHSYNWWIGAVEGNGTVDWSGRASFLVAPLFAPTFSSPTGTLTSTNTPRFSWTSATDAGSYKIWLTDNNTNQNTITVVSKSVTSWVPTSPLALNDQYTWWIASLSTNGAIVNWSTPSIFTISPPTSNPDRYRISNTQTTVVPTATGLLANDTDANSQDTLQALLVSPPSHGALTLNLDGSFTYTPDPTFTLDDSFTYKVGDGTLYSTSATVKLIAKPVALPQEYSDHVNTTLTETDFTVLWDDGNGLNIVLTAQLMTLPSHGHLTLYGDGSFTYVPYQNFLGTDSFTYRATDGEAFSDPTAVTIKVLDNAPVVDNTVYPAHPGVPLISDLSQFASDDDDAFTLNVVQGPQQGSLSLNPSGTFQYTPNPNASGQDSFTYCATDGVLTSNVGVVTINIENEAPVGVADSYRVSENNALHGSVLDNDYDVDGDTMHAVLATVPNDAASFALNSDGTFSYTPSSGFVGNDSFTYQVGDGSALSAPVSVSIAIAPGPITSDDVYYLPEDGSSLVVGASQGVLANDLDPQYLHTSLLQGVTTGILMFNQDGSFTYQPPAFSNTALGIGVAPISFEYVATKIGAATQSVVTTVNLILIRSAQGIYNKWWYDNVRPVPTLDKVTFNNTTRIRADVGSVIYSPSWTPSSPMVNGVPLGGPVAVVAGSSLNLTVQISLKAANQKYNYLIPSQFQGNSIPIAGGIDGVLPGGIYGQATFERLANQSWGLISNGGFTTNWGVAQPTIWGQYVGYYPQARTGWTVLPSWSKSFLPAPANTDWIPAAGTSYNPLYMTYLRPLDATVFLTVLNVGSVAADGDPVTNRSTIITSIWGAFADPEGGAPPGIKKVGSNTNLTYYGTWNRNFGPQTTSVLLRVGDGDCVIWSRFLVDVLKAQGIVGVLEIANPASQDDTQIAVKAWQAGLVQSTAARLSTNVGFLRTPNANAIIARYPYANIAALNLVGPQAYNWLSADVTDLPGIPGQGTANPASIFINHVVVRISEITGLYDPSYGRIWANVLDLDNNGIDFYIHRVRQSAWYLFRTNTPVADLTLVAAPG